MEGKVATSLPWIQKVSTCLPRRGCGSPRQRRGNLFSFAKGFHVSVVVERFPRQRRGNLFFFAKGFHVSTVVVNHARRSHERVREATFLFLMAETWKPFGPTAETWKPFGKKVPTSLPWLQKVATSLPWGPKGPHVSAIRKRKVASLTRS